MMRQIKQDPAKAAKQFLRQCGSWHREKAEKAQMLETYKTQMALLRGDLSLAGYRELYDEYFSLAVQVNSELQQAQKKLAACLLVLDAFYAGYQKPVVEMLLSEKYFRFRRIREIARLHGYSEKYLSNLHCMAVRDLGAFFAELPSPFADAMQN